MRLLTKFATVLGLSSAFVFALRATPPTHGGNSSDGYVTETEITSSIREIVVWCINYCFSFRICDDCGQEMTPDSEPTKTNNEADGSKNGPCESGDTTSDGSIIDNMSLNHIHSAFDYRAEVPGGCAPCGSSGGASFYPAVYLKRTHRYREVTEKSSFGHGIFSNWDASLTLFVGSGGNPYVDFFSPELNGRRRFSKVGSEFRDLTYNASRGLRLYDSSNNLTTVKASAVRAEHENLYGLIYEFEFFDLDASRRCGRLTKIRDRDRDIFTLTYVDPVSSSITPSSRKWRFDSVTDSYGQTLTFTHTSDAIKRCYLPDGSQIVYNYTGAGNSSYTGVYASSNYLSSINFPDGATSTFSRFYNSTYQKLGCYYDDASAKGTHRRKTAYLTTQMGTSAAVDNNEYDSSETGQSVQFFNQSSSLVRLVKNGAGSGMENGEVAYLSITGGPDAQRYIYEGGGKLKWVNLNAQRYQTVFTLPTSSTANPYTTLETTATGEPTSAYEYISATQYLDNRQSRPRDILKVNGVRELALYDHRGFQTLKGYYNTNSLTRSAFTEYAKLLWTQDYDGTLTDYDYEDSSSSVDDNVGKLIRKRTGLQWGTASSTVSNQPGLRYTYKQANYTTLSAATSGSVTRTGRASNLNLTPAERSSQFALIFTGNLNVPSGKNGSHTFTAYADDGIQVKINGTTVLSRDGVIADNQAYTNLYAIAAVTGTATLNAGANSIEVTYYHSTGTPRLELRANGPLTGNQEAFLADTLFTSDIQSGDRILTTTGDTIEHNWEYHSSGPAKGFIHKEYYPNSSNYREHLYTYSGGKLQFHEIKEPDDSGTGYHTAKLIEYYTTGTGAGQIKDVTDGEGHVTGYSYDYRGRLFQTTYPDSAVEIVFYPNSGLNSHQPSARRERSGGSAPIYTVFGYDNFGRLNSVKRGCSDMSGTGALSTETLSYLAGSTKVIKRISDGDTSENFYDYRGRVKESWRWADEELMEISRTNYLENKVFYREDRFSRRTYFAYETSDAKLKRTLVEAVPSGASSPSTFSAVLSKSRIFTDNPAYAISDYTYDSVSRQLTLETDPLGIVTKHEYDDLGRKTDQYQNYQASPTTGLENDQNLHTKWVYNSQGLVERVYTPRDFTDGPDSGDSYTYTRRQKVDTHTQAEGSGLSRSQNYFYDKDGRVVRTLDFAGQEWNYFYLCCGRLGAKIDPLGHGERYSYNDAGDMTRVQTVANLSTVPTPSSYSLSATALTTTDVVYDRLHRRTSQTVWLNGATPGTGTGLTTTWEFLTDVTDTRLYFLTDFLDAGGITMTGPANGSATIVTNPAGERSAAVMDGLGRTLAAGSIGTSGNTPYNYAYTYFDELESGLVRSTTFGLSSLYADILRQTLTDGLGRVRKMRTYLTSSTYQETSMTYLANGVMTSQSQTVGAQTLQTTFGYDPLRRQRWSQDEVEKAVGSVSGVLTGLTYKPTTGAFRAFTYDAASNLTFDYDALGRANTHAYDILNRRTSTQDHLGNLTAMAYDTRDQLRVLKDAGGTNPSVDGGGNLTLWTYDARGDLIRKDFGWDKLSSSTNLQTWLNGTHTYPLPTVGTLFTVTRPSGDNDRIIYAYDAAGRLTAITDQAVTSTTPNLEFTYDGASRLLTRGMVYTSTTLYDRFAYDAASRLRFAHSGLYFNTVERTYDTVGRQAKEILHIESGALSATDFATRSTGGTTPPPLLSKETTYAHDAASRITSVTYPSGFVLTKTYDHRSNLDTLVNSSTTLADYGYDDANRETTRLLANGLTTTRAWNTDSTLASLTVSSSGGTIDPLTLSSLGYTAAKELTSVGRVGTAMSQFGWNATYDNKSRLDTWKLTSNSSGSPDENYDLDPAGNWNSVANYNYSTSSVVTTSRTHTNAKNQITAIGGNALTHDARGNMTQNNSGDTFTYDILNQLVASNVVVGSNNPVSSYTYDALGRRVRQTVVDGSSTVLDKIYFYGPDFKLLESADITTATSSSFVISTSSFTTVVWGRSFNELAWTSADGYLHGDQINSVIGNSNSSGTVTKVLTYTPYGQRSEWTLSGTTLTAATFAIGEMDFGYSGELRDPSGLIYYGYRYYNPELGRWVNRDPIEEQGGVNLYELTHSIALNAIDLWGLLCQTTIYFAHGDPSGKGGHLGNKVNEAQKIIDANEAARKAKQEEYDKGDNAKDAEIKRGTKPRKVAISQNQNDKYYFLGCYSDQYNSSFCNKNGQYSLGNGSDLNEADKLKNITEDKLYPRIAEKKKDRANDNAMPFQRDLAKAALERAIDAAVKDMLSRCGKCECKSFQLLIDLSLDITDSGTPGGYALNRSEWERTVHGILSSSPTVKNLIGSVSKDSLGHEFKSVGVGRWQVEIPCPKK